MSDLSWSGVLIGFATSILSSILAGVFLGLVSERRNMRALQQFEQRVVLGNIRIATSAVAQLAQYTKNISMMADEVRRMGPFIERLCGAVERAPKK